jgi:hypothetical protein
MADPRKTRTSPKDFPRAKSNGISARIGSQRVRNDTGVPAQSNQPPDPNTVI